MFHTKSDYCLGKKKKKKKYLKILGGTRAVAYLAHYETPEERSDLLRAQRQRAQTQRNKWQERLVGLFSPSC